MAQYFSCLGGKSGNCVYCEASVNMPAATAGGCGGCRSTVYWTAVDLPVTHAASGCGHCGSTVFAFLL